MRYFLLQTHREITALLTDIRDGKHQQKTKRVRLRFSSSRCMCAAFVGEDDFDESTIHVAEGE